MIGCRPDVGGYTVFLKMSAKLHSEERGESSEKGKNKTPINLIAFLTKTDKN